MAEAVGFVGLGVMGKPMAQNMSTTYQVHVFDVDPQRAADMKNVVAERSIADLGRACSIVCLSLPNSAAVEQVILGSAGLISVLNAGSTVIDLSTTSPTVSRRIFAELSKQSIDFLDAPVSGGGQGAIDASLSIMIGGKQEVIDAHRPILETIGSSIVRVGDVGAGGVAKLVNNMIVGAEFAAIAEGFALGARAGIPAVVLYDAIKGGWAGSKVLDVSATAMINSDYRPGGTVGILSKDLGYARNLAREYELPVPVTAIVDEVFTTAKSFGNTNIAQPSMIQMWERLMSIDVVRGASTKEEN